MSEIIGFVLELFFVLLEPFVTIWLVDNRRITLGCFTLLLFFGGIVLLCFLLR